MLKHKIIFSKKYLKVEDLRLREWLREEKGLQREFTTYTFPVNSESVQTLQDLEDASSVSSGQDWCIIQEQNDWEFEELINSHSFYEMEDNNWEEISLQPKQNKMEQINATYLEQMAAITAETRPRDCKTKFCAVLRVKTFVQDASPVQIQDIEESLQSVKFGN